VTAPSHSRISVTNRGPCERTGETFTCATFEMKTVVDSEALATLTARLQKDSPMVLSSGVMPLELEEVIRVTMETGTMLPHEMVLTRVTRLRVTVSGESGIERDAESRRSVFVYEIEPEQPGK
jgi:hypothetical protein